MTHAINIAYILPAVAIILLAVTVLVLTRQLLRSQRTLKQLREQLNQLKLEKTETELELSKVTETLAVKESKQRLSEKCTLDEEDFADGAKMTDNVLMMQIEQLMKRNIGNASFTANTIAEVLALSRAQLDRRIKRLTGKTPSAYLLDRRMIYARELLLTTEIPIADVAMACGFEDTSYFTRVFKQHYGSTPSGMRG